MFGNPGFKKLDIALPKKVLSPVEREAAAV